jgi:hypothetical protein
MADVLVASIRDVDHVIAFAPTCPPDDSIVAIGSHPHTEIVHVRRRQIVGELVADDVARGINGTRARYWAAGTPWRYVSPGSTGTSTSA